MTDKAEARSEAPFKASSDCPYCAGEAGRLSGQGEDSDSAEVTDDMLKPLK